MLSVTIFSDPSLHTIWSFRATNTSFLSNHLLSYGYSDTQVSINQCKASLRWYGPSLFPGISVYRDISSKLTCCILQKGINGLPKKTYGISSFVTSLFFTNLLGLKRYTKIKYYQLKPSTLFYKLHEFISMYLFSCWNFITSDSFHFDKSTIYDARNSKNKECNNQNRPWLLSRISPAILRLQQSKACTKKKGTNGYTDKLMLICSHKR